jgi:enediyne biosynthesis protein E4
MTFTEQRRGLLRRARRWRRVDLASLVLAMALLMSFAPCAGAWQFADVTSSAGLSYTHGYANEAQYGEAGIVAGGVAAGDYDRDGYVDLFLIRGDAGPAMLFRNQGDGTFADTAAAAGVAVGPGTHSSATFADVNGDGWLDLLVLGFSGIAPRLFENQRDGTFLEVTATAGILPSGPHTFSATFGDYDKDGDLDLFVSQWASTIPLAASPGSLWRNDGAAGFTDVSVAAGIPVFYSRTGIFPMDLDLAFTANFVDIDHDGWPDLLVAGDFGASRVLRNQTDGTFADVTDGAVITDENGMGAAIGDYDGDGDLDWFVSSIWDPNGIVEGHWGISGNRLYANNGDGTFTDVTDAAGVRYGYWGWGSTFADLDNDGDLDLVHVNGWGPRFSPESSEYHADPTRCFVSNGDGTFTEQASALGVADTGLGRGVVAFDLERDGDLDLLLSNNSDPPVLLRNDGNGVGRHLGVKLLGSGSNSEAIGARVEVTIGGATQVRELRAGSNFESQDPAEAHFGTGSAEVVDEVRIEWPSGSTSVLQDVAAGQSIVLNRPRGGAPTCDGGAPENDCIPGGPIGSRTECMIEWLLTPAPLRDPTGVPIRIVRCRDGDPTCDLDGENGACTFATALCVNNTDPRLPKCTPSDIQRIEVKSPRKTSRSALDRDVHAQLAAAFGPGGGLGVTVASPLRNATPDYCSEPIVITVPLGTSASGKPRTTTLRIGLKARASNRRADTDLITFRCMPPA